MIDYLTLGDMLDRIGKFVQDSGTIVREVAQHAVNQFYAEAATRILWPELIRLKVVPVDVLQPQAGGPGGFFLPADVHHIRAWPVSLTHHKQVTISDAPNFLFDNREAMLLWADPIEMTDAGFYSQSEMVRQTEKLYFVSSENSDTQDFLIKYFVAGGIEYSETITLQGTTPVITSYPLEIGVPITSISSGDETRTGIVLVYGADSATNFLTLYPNEKTKRHRAFYISPMPPGSPNLGIAYCKGVTELTDENEVPEIPVSRALVEYGIGLAFQHFRKGQQARDHLAMAEALVQTAMRRREIGDKVEQMRPAGGSFGHAMKYSPVTTKFPVG